LTEKRFLANRHFCVTEDDRYRRFSISGVGVAECHPNERCVHDCERVRTRGFFAFLLELMAIAIAGPAPDLLPARPHFDEAAVRLPAPLPVLRHRLRTRRELGLRHQFQSARALQNREFGLAFDRNRPQAVEKQRRMKAGAHYGRGSYWPSRARVVPV
jgi:hypothetical protein